MPRGRPKEFDRDAVLEKAMDLFWDQGYAPTGLTELTRHMGIGRQSLYDTFGDKKALFLAALDHYSQIQLGQVNEMLEAPGSPFANIRSIFAMWKDRMQGGEICGCMMANAIAEFGEDDPEIARFLDQKMRRIEKAFHGAFERAAEAGELREGTDPRVAARLAVAVGQGLAVLGKSSVGIDMVDDVLTGLESAVGQG
jgi:TetR/AcrR family transcriptional repressor of nem operon